MITYSCHICGGSCDPGELENGVCFGCRRESAEKIEAHNLDIRKSINQLMKERIREQHDGQMVMRMM